MFVFEKIRDGVTGCRFDAAQLEQRPCVAAVIGAVQADVQKDLAALQAGWFAAREHKVQPD